MKAVTRTKYGSPSVLKIQEVEKPAAKADEVLVRVYNTTVNRTDCGILWGKPYAIRLFTGVFKPSSDITGTDFAGKIEAIGKDVTAFQVGDRVWGFHDEGLASHAQYMVIKAKKAIAKIPKGITYEEACASAEGAHYAYNSILRVKLNPGDKALVNGATGAIGSAVVQILKHMGVKVTAVGNTKNIEMIKSLGADKVYNYEKEDFTKDDGRYHFISDAVGKSSFPRCKHLLLPKGIYISSELGPNAQNLYLPLITKIKGGKRVLFPIPLNCRRSVLNMNKLLETKKFKPVIDRVYKMDAIAEAYTYVRSGQKTGNVIIDFR